MKLSAIREVHQADSEGRWFWWRDTIHVRVRGASCREHQMAIRAANLAHPAPTPLPADAKQSDIDQRAVELAEREEVLGQFLLPSLAQNLLTDWWGVDAESEPQRLDGAAISGCECIATVGKVRLLTLQFKGKIWRPLDMVKGEPILWQEMEPFSSERALEAMRDPGLASLVNAVRAASEMVDDRRLRADAEALGKLLRLSGGE